MIKQTISQAVLAVILLIVAMSVPVWGGDARIETIHFAPGVSLNVLSSGEGDFLGIGSITVDDIRLSDAERGMRVEVVGRKDKYDVWHKPAVIAYRRQKLVGVSQQGDEAVVTVNWVDEDGEIDRLEIIFEYFRETFYESDVAGLRYRFRWQSESRYAHQVRETSWWTFGESVDGVRWISQNSGYGRGSCDFVVPKGMPFGGYKPFDKIAWGDVRDETLGQIKDNPILFGHLAQMEAREVRLGDGEFVTFVSQGDRSFLRYADEPSMNYWELEREKGDRAVRFEEWYCEEMGQKIETTPIVVAVLSKGGINAWIDANEIVRAKLLRAAGLPHQDPLPWVGYTQYAIDDPKELKKQLPHDRALELMREYGIKDYWWYGPWRSNWSEESKMTAEQIEKHKVYGHAVWDYDWAYNKFNVPALKGLMEQSREEGIEPVIWATQTMSLISPHVLAHPDWANRRPDGSLFNYIYVDLVGMSHASGYSDFLVNRIKSRMKELPFESLWLDSFCFSANKLDWMNPNLTPNLMAAIETFHKLRKAGVKRIYTELNCPLALSSATGMIKKDKYLAGEQTYLLYHSSVVDHTELKPEVYFKNLAYKSCPQPYLRSYLNKAFAEPVGYINKAYVKALPEMKKCVHLEGDMGTLWWNGDRSRAVIFSFGENVIEVGKNVVSAVEIMSERPCKFRSGSVSVEANQVYLVDVE